MPKPRSQTMVTAALLIGASFCRAATNYCVAPSNTGDYPPYTNWVMAATNIQDVLNRTLAGDTVYLTNGHYYLTGAVTVAKAVTIKSYNNGTTDPANTIIDGNNDAGKPVTNRCFEVSASSIFDGLTVIGGRSTSWGGGIYCSVGSCVIKDCLIGWNYTSGQGGSAVGLNGSGSSVVNCRIVSNIGASVVYFVTGRGSCVSNCVIWGNTNGAAFDSRSTTLSNQVVNCQIISNYSAGADNVIPAGGMVSQGILYRNCLIANNRSDGLCGGMRVYGDGTGTVESCTIAGNQGFTCGGIYTQSGTNWFFYNTIICSNVGNSFSDFDMTDAAATNRFYNSCCPTTALPPTQDNIQRTASFVDANTGNYRLTADSPCVNAGINQAWMTNAFDLDGNRRLDQLNGRVDMGAYEFIHTITLISGY